MFRLCRAAWISLLCSAAISSGCTDVNSAAAFIGSGAPTGPDGGATDARQTSDGPPPFGPGQAGYLCSADGGCGNQFLICMPASGVACRDPDASVTDAETLQLSVPTSDLPICPMTAPVMLDVCMVRYNMLCRVDSDCGPAGFTCNRQTLNTCQDAGADAACGYCNGKGGPCSSDGDCPQGWSCYSPCPCATNSAEPKGCYPPFAMFGCPACVAGVFDAGSP